MFFIILVKLFDVDTCTNNLKNNSMSASSGFTPRGSLARALYEKNKCDEYLSHFDKNQWYQCDLDKLSTNLSSKFIQLDPDEDTIKFLQNSEEKSDWIITQIWHSIAKSFLGWFMTQTSINGWLQRGSMFVLSSSQFNKLVKNEKIEMMSTFLDLGAGDGEVTAHLVKNFKQVFVTEISTTMKNLLKKRGYEILKIDNWYMDQKFDFISCLNLIDRCINPMELLKQIKFALNPNGRVLLAVVLPFSAYVESGFKHKPKEQLPICGSTFEEQVETINNFVLKPIGFDIVSWSRVPYLCEGDLQQSYYWLDDAIFLLKSSDN